MSRPKKRARVLQSPKTEEPTKPPEKSTGVTLLFERTDGLEAVVPMRWCLSKSVLETLKNDGARLVYLLVSVVWKHREVDRRLIPIDQMLEYLDFRRSGTHTVYATVLYTTNGDDGNKIVRKELLGRTYAESFKKSLFDSVSEPEFNPGWAVESGDSSWGSESSAFARLKPKVVGKFSIDVVVAEEFFAKEPSPWLKWWTTLLIESDPVDQCAMRKRIGFAFSVQPLIVALWWILGVALRSVWLLIALLMGARFSGYHRLKTSKIFTLDAWPSEVWRAEAEGSVFFSDKKGGEIYWRRFFTPFFWIAGIGAITMLNMLDGASLVEALQSALVIAKYALVIILSVFALLFIIVLVIRIFSTKPVVEFFDAWEARKARKKETNTLHLQEDLQLLVCDGVAKEVSIAALPSSRQTLRLRFRELKAKVCRPYPKS